MTAAIKHKGVCAAILNAVQQHGGWLRTDDVVIAVKSYHPHWPELTIRTSLTGLYHYGRIRRKGNMKEGYWFKHIPGVEPGKKFYHGVRTAILEVMKEKPMHRFEEVHAALLREGFKAPVASVRKEMQVLVKLRQVLWTGTHYKVLKLVPQHEKETRHEHHVTECPTCRLMRTELTALRDMIDELLQRMEK